jgi:FkbM family methyltransferase
MLQRAWRSVPESMVKNQIRLLIHNRRLGRTGSYAVRRGLYITALDGVKFRTCDPPFGAIEALQQFQALYHAAPGEIVIDAGAFKGWETLFFALKVGPAGRVISLEPDDQNLETLRRNLQLNKPAAKIEVLNQALWNEVGQIEFYQQGTLASSAFWSSPTAVKIRKDTTTIDAIVEQFGLPRVDFVKMNIEGAETKALYGAVETIRRSRPAFAIAADHVVDGKPTHPIVADILQSFGYEATTHFFVKRTVVVYGTAK